MMTTPEVEPEQSADDLLAATLAAGKSYKEAAERCGVSPATVYRRMCDPSFRLRVAAHRRHAVGVALNQISAALSDAVATLHLIAQDAEEESAVRVRASDLLIQHLLKLEERHTLEERLARLEALSGGTADQTGAA